MKKYLLLILSFLYLTGCEPGDKVQTISIDEKYSIAIPSFLKEADNLNEEASLQYQSLLRSFYVIAIDETKNEMQKAIVENNLLDVYNNDILGYSELILASFEQNVAVSNMSAITDTMVNGMPARLLTVEGRVEGMDIFYSLAFLEGKSRYYQVLAWTLPSKKNQYKEAMNRIMYSLKEL